MSDMTRMDDTADMDKLYRDFKVVVQDAEGLIKATADELGDRLNDKAQEARSRLLASLESAKDSYRSLEDRAMAGAKATDRAIRDHPYQSLGLAFGIGLLFGLLVSRR